MICPLVRRTAPGVQVFSSSARSLGQLHVGDLVGG